MDFIWLVVISAGLAAMIYFKRKDNAQQAVTHKAAIRRRYGREPDIHFEITNAGQDRRLLYAYIAERTLYIGKLAGAYNEQNVLTPDVVRSWSIEKTPYSSGRAVRVRYSVHIHTMRLDRALVEIQCSDAGEAHMVWEVVNQTLGATTAA